MPVKLALIGAGGMGSYHLRKLAEIPEAKLVAVCDVVEERARLAAEPLLAEIYTDPAELLDQADIDAVYICVPPHCHEDIEVRAARRRLHIFVEKPVSLYPDQALVAAKAIREAGVMSQVGYQLRYLPHSRQLKAFLADKQIGGAYAVRWSGAPEKDWWRRYDQGGGQLLEMTTHNVDMLRWLVGEIDAVAASYSFDRLFHGDKAMTVPDTQSVLLQFHSGASAVLTTSCALGEAGKSDLEIILPGGRASWGFETAEVRPEPRYTLPPLPTDNPSIDEVFVRAVATGDRSTLLSPYEDGLRTAAVTIAANRSAEQGGRLVTVDEVLNS